MFRYTAVGQKVAKLVYQTGKLLPQRTDYLGPYQYEDDSLRFFPHAEGRVLRFANTTSGAVRYEREFTFKDHLGNLRLAYRAGQRHRYEATLEQDGPTGPVHTRESQQFDSLSVSLPVVVPTGLARTGDYAARLNAGGATPHPLGPLTQITVQKGDTLFVTAPGRYQQATSSNSFAFSLAGFIASLLQPASGAPTGLDGTRRGGLPLLQVGLSSATLIGLAQLPGGVPKGYLRVLSFNEDSVLVDQRTVQLSAYALNNYETLSSGQLIVQQNGYVSVYVGNESATDVYFDDVTIEHRQGLQVQENQYDPYGLDLAGVSGAAPGLRLKNFYQFNGKENQLDLGLNWNHQDWRFFDYQIGRWHVVDPEIENAQESWTPYSFGFDNAVRYADANGRNPGDGWAAVTAVAGFTNGFLNAWASNNTTLPLPGAVGNGVQRVTPHSQAEALGQTAADVVSVVQGVTQMVQGGTLAAGGTAGGVATSETVVGAVAGYAVATAGVGMAAQGFNTAANGARNLLNNNGRYNASNVQQNKAKGNAFEKVVKGDLVSEGKQNIADEVTIKPNGTNPKTGKSYGNVRADFLSTLPGGNFAVTEAKSSPTARLTKNQKVGYPAIQANGGTIVGNKGAAQSYPAGTNIPPGTAVDIRRP